MLASQALMKPMQMSVKIRTICRRYEKKGASHRSRRHNTKVVNLSGGVIRQSAWRFAPKRAEFSGCKSGSKKNGGSSLPGRRSGTVYWALLQIVGGDKLIIPFC